MSLHVLDHARASLIERFLSTVWALGSTQELRTACGRGVATGQILNKVIAEGDFELPLPPLAVQKRIAGILDAADALRAKRREALAQLDTLLQSTFLDMFGDPVTNSMGWTMVTVYGS